MSEASPAPAQSVENLRRLLAEAEAAAAAGILDPNDPRNEQVRVYNRSRKSYRHADYFSAPQAFVTIPRWLAEKWIAMFPEDILPGDTALTAIDGTQAALLESQQLAKDLEAQKQALADELAATKAALAKAQGAPLGG